MSQIIIQQLETLYETGIGEVAINTFSQYGRHGLYNDLFDFLIKEGHKIDFDHHTKKQLYKLSINTFIEERKTWLRSGLMSEEGKKKEVEKFYKSYLVRKYLLDHYSETKERLIITHENGEKIKKITFGNIK